MKIISLAPTPYVYESWKSMIEAVAQVETKQQNDRESEWIVRTVCWETAA